MYWSWMKTLKAVDWWNSRQFFFVPFHESQAKPLLGCEPHKVNHWLRGLLAAIWVQFWALNDTIIFHFKKREEKKSLKSKKAALYSTEAHCAGWSWLPNEYLKILPKCKMREVHRPTAASIEWLQLLVLDEVAHGKPPQSLRFESLPSPRDLAVLLAAFPSPLKHNGSITARKVFLRFRGSRGRPRLLLALTGMVIRPFHCPSKACWNGFVKVMNEAGPSISRSS